VLPEDETANLVLATTGSLPPDEDEGESVGILGGLPGFHGLDYWCCWWGWQWWRHEASRDGRVEVFSNLVPGGIYRYSCVAQATMPGEFVVRPRRSRRCTTRRPSASVRRIG